MTIPNPVTETLSGRLLPSTADIQHKKAYIVIHTSILGNLQSYKARQPSRRMALSSDEAAAGAEGSSGGFSAAAAGSWSRGN